MNLKDYIHGQRHGKEANRLEREVMNDPFLQDAIDGYDSVEGNHASSLETLERRLILPQKRIDRRVWLWVAAAVMVLLIGIPFLLRQPDIKEEVRVASSEKATKEEEAAVLSPQKDSALMADKLELGKEENIKPSVQPALAPSPENRSMVVEAEEVISSAREKISSQEDKSLSVEKTTVKAKTRNIKQPQSDEMAVKGRIVDMKGEPIIGATINLKNSTLGTVSDMDGNFAFIVPKEGKGTLIASYVGMDTAEIPLEANVGDIKMKEDTELLSEVVVIGYATQRKSSYVGSVSKVKVPVPVFGEAEFITYFKKYYDKGICKDQSIVFTVNCYIDANGHVESIVIKENSCPSLESEIKRLLLGSPQWTQKNRKITLKVEI